MSGIVTVVKLPFVQKSWIAISSLHYIPYIMLLGEEHTVLIRAYTVPMGFQVNLSFRELLYNYEHK